VSEYLNKRLLVGNCLDKLKELADDSIDSIVTDPPYELGFMGKSWDSTGIAFNVDIWQECIRVLKPGGHLLAFSGSRTYHRMAVAIEDAGFEIRDQIMWLYGSGFPKSLDISKAIEKSIGISKQWQGWGTALKPAHEPIVVARKPLIGTVAETVLKYGTGGINIDASRVGSELMVNQPGSTNPRNSMGDGWRKDAQPTTATGRFPANVILTHNHDCQETGTVTETVTTTNGKGFAGSFEGGTNDNGGASKGSTTTTWSCTPGCPATQFPNSKSTDNKWEGENNAPIYGKYNKGIRQATYSDEGSAARFFYCAKASKKERNGGLDGLPTNIGTNGNKWTDQDYRRGDTEPKTERKNFHPTVKPIELMKYLIKLVTPPKGTVLDPFLGSGSTAVAAVLEGFEWKGCEMTDDYLPIIKARVSWAKKQVKKSAKQQELEL
jgi:DNA modification methylase